MNVRCGYNWYISIELRVNIQEIIIITRTRSLVSRDTCRHTLPTDVQVDPLASPSPLPLPPYCC